MVNERITANAAALGKELKWFSDVLKDRTVKTAGPKATTAGQIPLPPPLTAGGKSLYEDFLRHYKMTPDERLLLVLCLVPHVRPALLDNLFAENEKTHRGYTEFGGIRGLQHGGFLPTGETYLFLAAGDDLKRRFSLMALFETNHFFRRHQVLKLETPPEGEPALSGSLTLNPELVEYFTTGTARKPDLGIRFPARRLTTELEWEDLVLDEQTLARLDEIRMWIRHSRTLMNEWGMKKYFRNGYRSLFYGPPGTGKSLTATLLGKFTGLDVYRIDLSLIISKYIGETEKSLSRIFDKAEHKNWILFFDEADALFGKRTEISDAHDRYANQEVSYLLQRVEEYDGIVILASNLKTNLDASFTRRFDSIIYFPLPGPEERLRLWKTGFSGKAVPEESVDLAKLSAEFEISGGAIMNVVRYCSLVALNRGSERISPEDISDGIRKEFEKEGRTL